MLLAALRNHPKEGFNTIRQGIIEAVRTVKCGPRTPEVSLCLRDPRVESEASAWSSKARRVGSSSLRQALDDHFVICLLVTMCREHAANVPRSPGPAIAPAPGGVAGVAPVLVRPPRCKAPGYAFAVGDGLSEHLWAWPWRTLAQLIVRATVGREAAEHQVQVWTNDHSSHGEAIDEPLAHALAVV